MCRKHHHHRGGHHRHGHRHHPRFAGRGIPVNVREFDDRYELHLLAPGRTREDFTLELADDLMIIKGAGVTPPEEGQWQRKEYRLVSFERSFELSEKIDPEGISAAYEAGILRVQLPKQSDRVTQRRELEVE